LSHITTDLIVGFLKNYPRKKKEKRKVGRMKKEVRLKEKKKQVWLSD
jgi:hypothetical protein